ncbi:hypothetical protein KHA93_20950 [Bacillus sp. FJAT-49732]|uniref:Uncharacterized protein n=1 Tax=Lederbergia citrisecunda TaxID=2833583 RepID=A0A942TPH2_9BACI|nr:hypothetical protein [Lederbergia citrisecunda]MBS4202080.1 hypothetical protein [Lederbergia citrisecunda]
MMFELLFQDSYTEWVVPLTLAITWLLSWQIFLLSHPVQANRKGKIDTAFHINHFSIPVPPKECLVFNITRFIKTVKRKEAPDDMEGPHLLFL